MTLDPDDLAWIRETGRDPAAVEAQLSVLRGAPPKTRLVRPCRLGDGLGVLEGTADLERRAAEVAARGRVSAFVPASGAATRMFEALVRAWRSDGQIPLGPSADDAARALLGLTRLALWEPVSAALRARGHDPAALLASGRFRPVLDAMFEDLDLAGTPKGLVPFHREEGGVRTAFEEQLAEAAALARSASGVVRAHFTVSAEHEAGFREALARAGGDAKLDVGFSVQHPATDTVAIDAAGAPVRDEAGRLLFRPGGHGALLRNLAAVGGDLVLMKNIDNVVPAAVRGGVLAWRARLLGLLVAVEEEVHGALRRLEAGDDRDAARLAVHRFGRDAGGDPWAALHRPIRVCGMVPNQGQPGGGPFWADDGSGAVTPQIVEAAQVDRDDPAQAALLAAATHFNPVDLALSLRDHRGAPYDLEAFADRSAAIVTRKSAGGLPITAIEHPGLWNGGMAGWNTIFVELPPEVFAPVKTVADLLAPPHLRER